jgi:hypothetical protein
LRADTPDIFEGNLAQVLVQGRAGNDRKAGGLLPLRGDLGHHLGGRKAKGERQPQLTFEVFFDACGDCLIG